MLFCLFAKCSLLREVSGAAGKTNHFQLQHIPKKSSLGEANQRRGAEVFGKIYKLLMKYCHIFLDSRIKDVIYKQIEIFDSTINSFFLKKMLFLSRINTKNQTIFYKII